jgi:hypothetical protein
MTAVSVVRIEIEIELDFIVLLERWLMFNTAYHIADNAVRQGQKFSIIRLADI